MCCGLYVSKWCLPRDTERKGMQPGDHRQHAAHAQTACHRETSDKQNVDWFLTNSFPAFDCCPAAKLRAVRATRPSVERITKTKLITSRSYAAVSELMLAWTCTFKNDVVVVVGGNQAFAFVAFPLDSNESLQKRQRSKHWITLINSHTYEPKIVGPRGKYIRCFRSIDTETNQVVSWIRSGLFSVKWSTCTCVVFDSKEEQWRSMFHRKGHHLIQVGEIILSRIK